MALGYEGYVRVGGKYALGTGTSVPRARSRLDSSSGYGGRIKTPVEEIGIGAPRTYDWDRYEGTLSFEVTRDFWSDPMYAWIFDRQTAKEVDVVSRYQNQQQYVNAFWSSISVSASEPNVVEGSIGFTAIERTAYAYGMQGPQGFISNKTGQGLLCPAGVQGFPKPLNEDFNLSPIPFWNTKVSIGGNDYSFVSWSLSFAQDVVLFFAGTHAGGADPGPKAPEYLAVGPMTVTMSGDYMFKEPTADGGTGAVLNGVLTLADQTFKMNKMEKQTISDDVQSADSTVPLSVEYAVYDIKQS